jgi:hypothetical protein
MSDLLVVGYNENWIIKQNSTKTISITAKTIHTH